MGLLVNIVNYSTKSFKLFGEPQVKITFNESVNQSPIQVLLANDGTTSMQITQNALGALGTDQYSMALEYMAEDKSAYFGIACVQYPQVFGIGGNPDWTVRTRDGNWVNFSHSTSAYIWTFPQIKITAVPVVTHSDITVHVTITQNR